MPVDASFGDGDGDVEADLVYDVVVNHEEQYSIWPVGRPAPAGWTTVGVRGTKSQVLDHIERVWSDITPLSVRQAAARAPRR
ncbi:MbtH family protein [Streptomyces sp. AC627_RSS907]|uniref:MbtH family protein n=1 Tax=Streptomyces sp. AC627_RSS907 TaxID=2823684 RepID=UPI001C279AD1|nr:MbtH family protein [Streptomyces sp. AC627_RSS907]